MSVSTDILATTLAYVLEQETEAVKRRHAFLDYAEKAGGIVEIDGGSKVQVPVAVKDHSVITYHTDGYEATDETIQDVMNYAEYPWAFWTAPVAISAKRRLENSGERAIIDLYSAHLKSTMDLLGRNLNAQILNGSLSGTALRPYTVALSLLQVLGSLRVVLRLPRTTRLVVSLRAPTTSPVGRMHGPLVQAHSQPTVSLV